MKRLNLLNLFPIYLFSLGALALLNILSFVLLVHLIDLHEHYGAVINMSGRQRMLAHRVALFVQQVGTLPLAESEHQRLTHTIAADVALFEHSHKVLLEGDPLLNLPGKPSEAIQQIFFDPLNLDLQVKQFIQQVRAFLELPVEQQEHFPTVPQIVNQASTPLLLFLDQVVSQYQQESEAAVEQLRYWAYGTLMAMLFALGLQALLIFWPMSLRIRNSVLDITDAHTQLETYKNDLEIQVTARTSELEQANETLRQEVRDRQQAEQNLHRSHQELRDLKRALDEAAIVAVTDAKGVITHVNNRFCEIAKYTRDELLGQNHRIINSGHHSKAFFRTMWKTIAQGHVWKGEIKNQAKDGSFYWVDTTIVPFLNDQKKPYQYIAIRWDISELKHAQGQHQRSMLESFASGLAHEVGNPLGAIRTTVQLMQEEASEIDPDGKRLDSILLQIDRLHKLIRDFNALGRPSAPHFSKHRLEHILQGVLPLFRSEAKQKNIQIIQDFQAEVDLWVDSQQIQQVIMNLVVNSFQVLEDGGKVEFRIYQEAETAISVLSIQDNGPGIAEELQEKIFEPFFTTRLGGTGFGLSLAKTLMEQNRGQLEVHSQLRVGTTFLLKFSPLSSNSVEIS